MSIQTLARCGVALFLVGLMSGCSLLGGGSSSSRASSECRWNKSSCMYEGPYDEGEADYARDEAARLNRASSVRIRSR